MVIIIKKSRQNVDSVLRFYVHSHAITHATLKTARGMLGIDALPLLKTLNIATGALLEVKMRTGTWNTMHPDIRTASLTIKKDGVNHLLPHLAIALTTNKQTGQMALWQIC